MNVSTERWHLRKEVSLVTIGLLITNLVTGAAYFTTLANRVSSLERENVTNARVLRLETVVDHEGMARRDLEARTVASLEEIKVLIRELNQRLASGPPR